MRSRACKARSSTLKEVGSHSVMFVKTTRISVRDDGDGLIYFDRNFHRVPRVCATQ